MKKALIIALIVALSIAIGFFLGGRLFDSNRGEWQEQYDLGVRYLSEGKYEDAIIAFSAAINIDPYQTSAYMRRIEAYAAVGGEENYRKALQDCDTVLSMDDKLISVWLGAAALIERLEGPEAALDFLQQALEKTDNEQAITDKIREMEDNIQDDVSGETTAAETVEMAPTQPFVIDEEPADSTGMAVHLGASTDSLIERYGIDYYTDYWEGGKFIKFNTLDVMFFYDQATNQVFSIVCSGPEAVTSGLKADMTYNQLRDAVPAGVTLDPPESYYNQMDEQNEYFVRFSIDDLNICYTWLDDPFTNSAYTVSIDGVAPHVETTTPADSLQESNNLQFTDIPAEYVFTSGAGAWGTDITISDDGSFVGSFHDSNMGETGADHPNGTVYYCDFSGKFSEPVQVNQYVYKLELMNLTTDDVEGSSYVEDGVKYISGTPYGFDGPSEYYLYLPGIPANMMPEYCYSWVKRLEGGNQGVCNSYVICSSNGELPFIAMS